MQWAKYFSVIVASMLKFVAGPVGGAALGLHWVETCICTVIGMMCSVVVFTYLGRTLKNTLFRRFYARRRLFTPRNRRMVRIWSRYGMAGVAFLTPLLLTPIGGTLAAASFGESKARIFSYMLLSAVGWGIVFSLAADKLGHLVAHWL